MSGVRPGVLDGRHRLLRWLRADLVVPAVLVTLSVIVVALHVRAYTEVGPVDELQHLDYLFRIPDVVASGDKFGHDAMRVEACRGLDAAFQPPACSTPLLRPEQFQEAGFNTAYIHPPTYYFVTRAAATAIDALPGIGSLFTAARLAGAAWLGAGLVATFAAATRLRARRRMVLAVVTVVAASPAVLMPAATVNPDAASLVVGGACLWCVLAWEDKHQGVWLLVAAGVVAEVIKLQNLVVLLGLGTYMLLRAIEREHGAWRVDRTKVVGLVVMGISAGAAAGIWTVVMSALAHVPPDEIPMSQRFLVDDFPAHGLLVTLGDLITPLAEPYVVPPLRSDWTDLVVTTGVWMLLFGTLAAALLPLGLDVRVVTLARAWLIVGLLAGPFLVVLNYVGQGQYIDLPLRYGLTLVPGFAVVTAAALTSGAARAVASALASFAAAVIAIQLAVA